MAATLGAQPIQRLALVSVSPITDEIGVRVVDRPRLRTIAAGDRETLLREVCTGEMVGEVGGREDRRAVRKKKHGTLESRGGVGDLT